MMFENRQEAGKKLASELLKYRQENPYVLAMPRGGVPIGLEVAEVLQSPLSVIVVRKIGLSGNPEYGIGAIAEGGVKILDQTTIQALGIDEEELEDTIKLEEEELNRRVKIYRDSKPLPNLKNRTAILVDDGMATGVTAKAAIESVKKLNPKKIVLATPVCPLDTVESLKQKVTEVICLFTPFNFMAVGSWYKEFAQVSDDRVVEMLKKANRYWSEEVNLTSDALDLEEGVFIFKDPQKIALSLKKSAEESSRRKASPFQSAMSMLNFYINRAGKNLDPKQRQVLDKAKIELRKLFGKI